MKLLECSKLGLESAYFTRMLVDSLRLRAVRLLERFDLRLRRFIARLPIDLLECLGRNLAEQEAGNEQVGGDALVDGGVVAEKIERLALMRVGKRPACAAAVSV